MSLQAYLAFVAACIALALLPGPVVTLVIANGGEPIHGPTRASVTYVEVATHRLLDKFEFQNPELTAGHLALTAKGDLAVVSAPRDGLPEPLKRRGAKVWRHKLKVCAATKVVSTA